MKIERYPRDAGFQNFGYAPETARDEKGNANFCFVELKGKQKVLFSEIQRRTHLMTIFFIQGLS
jgi:hypothetical protein